MEKITLNEYLKQGSVVENLKNFVGVTPENTVGLMTPERLAAVAGGLRFKGQAPLTDDVIPDDGIYNNMDDDYYPHIWSLIIVLKNRNVTTEILVNGAFHNILTRRHNGTSWNEWK